MNLTVWTEARFVRTPDGAIWTPAANHYEFWTRYLAVFDEVRVVARLRDLDSPPATSSRVDGSQVGVRGLPYYEGSSQLLRVYGRVRKASLRVASARTSAMLFRVPSVLAGPPIALLRRQGRPYGLEVVGDPNDVFRRGASTHALRSILRIQATASLRRQCQNASAVSYVTERKLQEKYPAAPSGAAFHYSSVDLPPEAFVSCPRSYDRPIEPPIRLVTVASMEQPYKGVDTLIDTISLCADLGDECALTIVGDGRLRAELESLAHSRTAPESITFLGTVSQGGSVRDVLDRADLFVLASRTEGLPRAVIEAMARGLPVIGTNVGGIPELLDEDALVEPDAPRLLAAAIRDLASNPDRLTEVSRRNLEKAALYSESTLSRRRTDFLGALKAATEQDLHRRGVA